MPSLSLASFWVMACFPNTATQQNIMSLASAAVVSEKGSGAAQCTTSLAAQMLQGCGVCCHTNTWLDAQYMRPIAPHQLQGLVVAKALHVDFVPRAAKVKLRALLALHEVVGTEAGWEHLHRHTMGVLRY